MNCLECSKELSYIDHKTAMETFGVELCKRHQSLITKLIRKNKTPLQAVQLYYGLKEAGVPAMLEWWDGKKFVHIAISRVKLNIEIDTEYNMITHEQAVKDLDEAMQSFKNGFTTIRIPHILVKHYLKETINNVVDIVESLRANIKVI